MKRFIFLALVFLCFCGYAQEYPYNNYNVIKRTLYRELPVTGKDIIFLGNSITDWSEWSEIFGNGNVKNRGIAADKAEWLFDRIDYLISGKPAKLFLMIGINDLNAGRDEKSVARDIIRIVDMFLEGSPATKIFVQSILPQNDTMRKVAPGVAAKVTAVNGMLEKACAERGVVYLDIYSLLKDENGRLNADYSTDGLHLTGKGYLVWADFIRNYVNE